MQPGKELDIVKKLAALLVIQAQPASQRVDDVIAELKVVLADAEMIPIARGNDSFAAETDTVKLMKGIRLAV